ncbi:MAG: YraN family protein [Pelolinea sp.]|nr:YraN family protein [Pelolinea sp.]
MPTNNSTKKEIGDWGEEVATRFLIDNGVEIIDRNVRTQNGEIDIIGKKSDTIIFFEVKTRRSKQYGNPEDAVNSRKQEHIRRSALEYIQSKLDLEIEWRLDVISINVDWKNKTAIRWFENAISD